MRRGLEGREAAEEQRLCLVRAAILGAEHVAMAAFVADVGEGADLMRLCDPHRADQLHRQATVRRRQPLDRRLADGNREAEVGVVGADRDALVAGQAVEQDESAADLLRRRRVLRGAVAPVGDHAPRRRRRCSAPAPPRPRPRRRRPPRRADRRPGRARRGIGRRGPRQRPRPASAASACPCALSVKTSMSFAPTASIRLTSSPK